MVLNSDYTISESFRLFLENIKTSVSRRMDQRHFSVFPLSKTKNSGHDVKKKTNIRRLKTKGRETGKQAREHGA